MPSEIAVIEIKVSGLLFQSGLVHHIKPGADNNGDTGPGPGIGQVTEGDQTNQYRANDFEISQRGQSRSRSMFQGFNDEIMPDQSD